ncbi:hypothetical protein, partial [Haloferula sargassicola]|uniref:hypothetical protein n=1 Tax=Haloferula sargassicola TaxID=490096 RepID=UPI0033652FEF
SETEANGVAESKRVHPRSQVRQFRTPGSARGAPDDRRPYLNLPKKREFLNYLRAVAVERPMKKILVFAIGTLAGIASFTLEASERKDFVAAVSIAEGEVFPVTFSIFDHGGEDTIDLYLDGRKWTAPLILRDTPELQGNPTSKVFDAVFTSDDGMFSIILTGRFYDFDAGMGDGTIAVHAGATIPTKAGLPLIQAKLKVGSLTIRELKAEQVGAGS